MEIQPLIEGQYFHIYNRGVNSENLFKDERNYHYFLQQYKFYCTDVLETLAYCLLKNHFHLFVYIKQNVEVPRRDGEGMFKEILFLPAFEAAIEMAVYPISDIPGFANINYFSFCIVKIIYAGGGW